MDAHRACECRKGMRNAATSLEVEGRERVDLVDLNASREDISQS